MHKLGRSPKPMGEFLVRVTDEGKYEKTLSILSSHPLSEDRLDLMNRQDRTSSGPELLSAAEWAALKNVCNERPRRAELGPPRPTSGRRRRRDAQRRLSGRYSPSSLFAFPPVIAATVLASSNSVFATWPTGS